jgi:hypothetical protein
MAIYAIKAEPDNYDSLLLKDANDWERTIQLNGKPLGSAWKPLFCKRDPAHEPANRGKPVDITSLNGLALVFSKRALDTLAPLVGSSIEALPLELDCPLGEFYVINVLELVDCLDESRAEIERFPKGGKIMAVDKYAFKPGCTDGKHIFKLAGFEMGDVLVSEEFKRLVQGRKLVGTRFKAVG